MRWYQGGSLLDYCSPDALSDGGLVEGSKERLVMAGGTGHHRIVKHIVSTVQIEHQSLRVVINHTMYNVMCKFNCRHIYLAGCSNDHPSSLPASR